MKMRSFEAQVAVALRQAASGPPVSEITRKMEVSGVTFYRWKKLYANLVVAEIRRLKQLDVNCRRSWLSSRPQTIASRSLIMDALRVATWNSLRIESGTDDD